MKSYKQISFRYALKNSIQQEIQKKQKKERIYIKGCKFWLGPLLTMELLKIFLNTSNFIIWFKKLSTICALFVNEDKLPLFLLLLLLFCWCCWSWIMHSSLIGYPPRLQWPSILLMMLKAGALSNSSPDSQPRYSTAHWAYPLLFSTHN